jgi:NitT/TauT family transport system substrate-binding protein
MDASKDIQTIQTGGGPETVASLLGGNVDAAGLVAPGDFQVASRGYRYVVNGFDLKIPYAATCVVTLRSLINKRGPVIGRFMRTMAEASKLMHSDRALVYKVLGKYLRITDSKVLDASYNSETPPWNNGWRFEAALQASLDEIAPWTTGEKHQTGGT